MSYAQEALSAHYVFYKLKKEYLHMQFLANMVGVEPGKDPAEEAIFPWKYDELEKQAQEVERLFGSLRKYDIFASPIQ